ncbi:ATPase of 26S proteasome regulatory subunit 4 [Mortierella sp. AD032]|nr:ATPase of 26S proteasome regulatory subunit 4 [Mortierella sp. AD032]
MNTITSESPTSTCVDPVAIEKSAASSPTVGNFSSTPTMINPPPTATTLRSTEGSPLLLRHEGGKKAWLVVLGSFLIHSFVFAPTEYIFGIFEHHYLTIFPDSSPSSIAFVGSVGSAVTYLAGFLAGIVADRFGFRVTAMTGSVVMTVALVLASFSTQVWHLYLTQGILFGIGASLAYYPAIAVPSHYFSRKRGLATGIAVSGVGAGGLILAPLTNALIGHFDIYWTLRILAIICFILCGGASMLISESKEHYAAKESLEDENDMDEKPESSLGEDKSFFEALKVFKDPQFLSLSVAELAASIGFLIPLYYMQTYAVFIGLSPEKGALILGLTSGASLAGRVILGLISDYVPNSGALLFCSWATALAIVVIWTIAKSFGVLLLSGLMFGFFGGGYLSLVPVAVADSFGTMQMASTIGLMYAAAGLESVYVTLKLTTMGNQPSSEAPNSGKGNQKKEEKEQKKKWEPPLPTRVGKKKMRKGPDASSKLPAVFPTTRCRLKMLKMERIKDYLLMEEEFVVNQERLKPQEEKTQEERSKVDDLRGTPMSVGTLEEIIDDDHAIISTSNGPEYYVSILSFVDKDLLEPGCSILLHHKTMSVIGVLQDDADPMVSVMKLEKAPTESYADIGGLEAQIQEIKEAVELPLTHPELYEDMGVKPPKGVILYGVPGTGKTLLAKAVANQTSATFLRVVGSELIQKYLGDGPKLVRELFRVAEENAPSIVFIDEIDAIGTKRYDSNSGGEREIQRTMLELLNQLDGFDSRGDVKVIMATNQIESLDPALIRPGRIDRKIEFPMPDVKTKRRIFNIHTGRMQLADDVDLEEFVMSKDELSGADIKAVCTEAGLLALRERRMKVKADDFKKAKEKVLYRKNEGTPEGLYL